MAGAAPSRFLPSHCQVHLLFLWGFSCRGGFRPGRLLPGLILPGISYPDLSYRDPPSWIAPPFGVCFVAWGSPTGSALGFISVWGCAAPSSPFHWSISRICWVGPLFQWVVGFCGTDARLCLPSVWCRMRFVLAWDFVPTIAAPLLAWITIPDRLSSGRSSLMPIPWVCLRLGGSVAGSGFRRF